MTDIDGNLVTMAGSFGTLGFGTMEPGSGSLEEQISFTGITQNTNGSATLTGISSVTFAYPYTKTSGLKKTHAGSTSFVISNTSGFYDGFTSKNDDETIAQTWTFTAPNYPAIDVPATLPTLDGQFATKKYVDGVVVAGAPNANTTTKGIVQIATQAQVDAKTIIGSTSAYLVQSLDTQRSTLLSDYVLDTSTSPNVIVITPSPAISAYTTGQQFSFKIANTNTSPTVSLNVNGLGAKNITKLNGTTSPVASDMVVGQMIIVEYDGTNFQMVSPVANAPISVSGTPVAGDIIYANASASWSRLAAGTTGQILITNASAGTAPAWQTFGSRTAMGILSISSAGSPTVTGLSFRPSFVQFFTNWSGSSGANQFSGQATGGANATSQILTWSGHSVSSGANTNGTSTSAVVTAYNNSSVTQTLIASFFSFTSDGFILTAPTATVAQTIIYVAFQ